MSEPVIAVSEFNRILPDVCAECREKLLDRLHIMPNLVARSRASLPPILAGIAADTGVSIEEIMSKSRVREIVSARRRFCKVATQCGYSSPEIGRVLGMHHSSVLHLVHS